MAIPRLHPRSSADAEKTGSGTVTRVRILLAVCLSAAAVACSTTDPVDPCKAGAALLDHVPETDNHHVATCTDATCGNAHNPPTGGPHCPYPLTCSEFPQPQDKCQWVHNLEHGHLVLLYNCPDGCPDVVQALEAIAASAPQDLYGRPRALITPDPDLPGRVGAVVWGWAYAGDTVNQDAIGCLMTHQDEEAPEAGLPCP